METLNHRETSKTTPALIRAAFPWFTGSLDVAERLCGCNSCTHEASQSTVAAGCELRARFTQQSRRRKPQRSPSGVSNHLYDVNCYSKDPGLLLVSQCAYRTSPQSISSQLMSRILAQSTTLSTNDSLPMTYYSRYFECCMQSHVTINRRSLSAVENILLTAKIYFCFAQPQDATEGASTSGHVPYRMHSDRGLVGYWISFFEFEDV